MALPALLTNFSRETFIWLAVTLILGGAAAIATGRALAQAWRGVGRIIGYSAVIAAAACFLCYALFQVSAIPMAAIAENVAAGDYRKLASNLAVWGASFVLVSALAVTSWKVARVRMMAQQYGDSTNDETAAPPATRA
jgi:DMSO/TMAO reductase YedYZ heme-binding membrane subunit